MSQEADNYIRTHQLLSNWNDELEYLGYVLAEIVDPRGLDVRGFVWHQAADLPAIEDTLTQASKKPNSRLGAVVNKKRRKELRHLMSKSRKIRNAVAHHQTPCEQEMREMQRTRDELSGQLQSAIGLVACKFDIDHVRIQLFQNVVGRVVNSPH
ncbi:hypothetical protein BDV59DRAFT_194310 [Aspergillus ambiguus]|uniref:uncharacterized protein n=1 Tax=Aspergillus ambiguus TaxID=176160 RepID=UPI003CCD2371